MRVGPEIPIPFYLMQEELYPDTDAPNWYPDSSMGSDFTLITLQQTSSSGAFTELRRLPIFDQVQPAIRQSIELLGQESIESARLLTKSINLEDIKEKYCANGVYASSIIPKSASQATSTT